MSKTPSMMFMTVTFLNKIYMYTYIHVSRGTLQILSKLSIFIIFYCFPLSSHSIITYNSKFNAQVKSFIFKDIPISTSVS